MANKPIDKPVKVKEHGRDRPIKRTWHDVPEAKNMIRDGLFRLELWVGKRAAREFVLDLLGDATAD